MLTRCHKGLSPTGYPRKWHGEILFLFFNRPFSFHGVLFPWWQVGEEFQRGCRRRSEWVLVHVTMEDFHSPLPQKGLESPSSFALWGKNTAPTPLWWLCAQQVLGLQDTWEHRLLSAWGFLVGRKLWWLQTLSGSICFHTLSSTDGAAAGIPEFKLTPSCWMCLCKARAAAARQNRVRPPLLQCIKARDVFVEVRKGCLRAWDILQGDKSRLLWKATSILFPSCMSSVTATTKQQLIKLIALIALRHCTNGHSIKYLQ